ncbi:MAG: hypothetical protein OEW08_06020, partial [Gammaproteobacteria bacterium]|nr:hypothetical protein [Gammaproteobacteria bacterium]
VICYNIFPHKIRVVAICCAALTSAHAAGVEETQRAESSIALALTGFVYGHYVQRTLNSALNADNSAAVPVQAGELASVFDMRTESLWLRARLVADRKHIPTKKQNTADETNSVCADVPQFSWKYNLSDQTSFTIGRLNLTLDDGQSFHAIDILEDGIRGSDFEDRAGNFVGFPMLNFTYANALSAYRLIYADDTLTSYSYAYGTINPGFNRGIRQWVASARKSIDQLTATAVLQYVVSGNPGVGAALSYVPAPAWSFYTAGFASRGNPYPIHKNVILNRGTQLGAEDVYIYQSPVQPWLASDRKFRMRGLLGASFTTEAGTTWVAELWRDDRGMNTDQLQIWKNVVKFHDSLSNRVARGINLGYDMESLRIAHGTHLFLRMNMSVVQDIDIQPSLMLTRDGSGAVNARWTQRVSGAWEYWVETWLRFGDKYSQYGASPERVGIQFNTRWFF